MQLVFLLAVLLGRPCAFKGNSFRCGDNLAKRRTFMEVEGAELLLAILPCFKFPILSRKHVWLTIPLRCGAKDVVFLSFKRNAVRLLVMQEIVKDVLSALSDGVIRCAQAFYQVHEYYALVHGRTHPARRSR